MPFTRHYLERGPDYWIYKNPDVRYYIYGNPNKIYFEPCKNYPHDNVHYVYLYNLLLNNSRVGPLANKTLAYHYLKYLLTSRCVFSYNTKPLLTVLFNRMGLIPITIYWKRFEDILEEMAKYDDRISTLWDGYDYMRSYPATDIRNVPNATADYFIYYKEGKPVEQYSLEDIQNAPLMFYMRPLPARRPTSFEYSIKELSDGAYLYRNTFVYYPVFKNMPITDVLDEDTLLVKRISEGECDLEYDEIQHFTYQRQLALEAYPKDIHLNYDKNTWIKLCKTLHRKMHKAKDPYRDEKRAFYDSLRDILIPKHGYKLVRIYHGQINFDSDSAKDTLIQIINSAE